MLIIRKEKESAMLELNSLVYDVEKLPFFQKVISSKLMESRMHLKSAQAQCCEMKGSFPTSLYAILEIHDDQLYFVNQMYRQCQYWRSLQLSLSQRETVAQIEVGARQLEHLSHTILYKVETFKKMTDEIVASKSPQKHQAANLYN